MTQSNANRPAPQNGPGSGPNGAYAGKDFRAAYLPGETLRGQGQVIGLLQFDGFYQADITAYESANNAAAKPVLRRAARPR